MAGWPIFVGTIDNRVVGFSTYGPFRFKIAYQYTIEHSIYLDQSFKGKGIGSRLMKRLIDEAIKSGYHTIIAGVDSANPVSYRFHQKFGFEEVARFREVGPKFGKWLDLIFMQKML